MDDGSIHNFLTYTLVKKLGVLEVPNSHTYVVSLTNRDDNDVWNTEITGVQLEVQG